MHLFRYALPLPSSLRPPIARILTVRSLPFEQVERRRNRPSVLIAAHDEHLQTRQFAARQALHWPSRGRVALRVELASVYELLGAQRIAELDVGDAAVRVAVARR